MILKSSGLVPFENPITVPAGNDTITQNGTLLEFDAAAQSDNIARVISGTGPIQVNNGHGRSSGPNTFTTDTRPELVVTRRRHDAENASEFPARSELVARFHSPVARWDSARTIPTIIHPASTRRPVRGYKFNTHGQGVTLTNGLAGSGGTVTKVGAGTLTLFRHEF